MSNKTIKELYILAFGAIGLLAITTTASVLFHEIGHLLGGWMELSFGYGFYVDFEYGTGVAYPGTGIMGAKLAYAGAYAMFLIIPFLLIRHGKIVGIFASIPWVFGFFSEYKFGIGSTDFGFVGGPAPMSIWIIAAVLIFIAYHEGFAFLLRKKAKKSNKAQAKKSDAAMAEYVAQVNAIKARG